MVFLLCVFCNDLLNDQLGIIGKIWRLLYDTFQGVMSRVLYSGRLSEAFSVLQGVGQGRTLSAWLFLVMINDLAVDLDSENIGLKINDIHIPGILLADDTVVAATCASFLQQELDIVSIQLFSKIAIAV